MTGGQKDTPEPVAIGRIMVLPPLNMADIFGEDASLRSPISGKVFVTATVEPAAVSDFTVLLTRSLREQYRERVIGTSKNTLAAPELYASGQLRNQVIRAAMELGRRNHADAVMVSYLYIFKDRVGGSLSVKTPSSVSFELNLIKTTSGRLVWTGRYSDEQKALNENLLQFGKFVSRQGRWITASQMAEEGLDMLMKRLIQKYH